MIRNLKVLLAAAMALAAFGAFSASGAQAVETDFHCEVQPCTFTLKTDGAGKTAHHVYVVSNAAAESVSFTCERLTGHGTAATKTVTTLIVTGLEYDGCKDSFGNGVKVDMNGCQFEFTSHGHVTIVNCNAGKVIEVTISTECTATVSPGTTLTGVSYHNVVLEGNEQVTVEAKVPNIPVALHGTKAQCGIDPSKTPITSEYTTGNTLVTAETDPGGVMVNGWWA